VLSIDKELAIISVMLILFICLSLTIGTDIRLKAQTNATTTPSAIDTGFFTMEKLQRFRISYPSNWNITYDNDSISIIRAPNGTAMLIISVTDLATKSNFTLKQYSDRKINEIESLVRAKKGNVKLLESIHYLLSGNPGYKIVFLNRTQSINDSAPDAARGYYKTSIAWAVSGDKVYTISCSTDESRYPMYVMVCIDIMNSFELLQ
jgi:hypothetical protein